MLLQKSLNLSSDKKKYEPVKTLPYELANRDFEKVSRSCTKLA
jgi:hypothetical protein